MSDDYFVKRHVCIFTSLARLFGSLHNRLVVLFLALRRKAVYNDERENDGMYIKNNILQRV